MNRNCAAIWAPKLELRIQLQGGVSDASLVFRKEPGTRTPIPSNFLSVDGKKPCDSRFLEGDGNALDVYQMVYH